MKLSDKLAALEAAERASMPREEEPAVPVAKGNGSLVARAPEKQTKAQNKWSDAKRKVRDLVLAEIGPKLSGPKALKGASLEKEVKACLDRILRREEVRISPIERQRFLAEVMSDTLGYGPLDAPLADASITEIMCNGHDEIFIERNGLLERTDLAFADEDQYRQVIDMIV